MADGRDHHQVAVPRIPSCRFPLPTPEDAAGSAGKGAPRDVTGETLDGVGACDALGRTRRAAGTALRVGVRRAGGSGPWRAIWDRATRR